MSFRCECPFCHQHYEAEDQDKNAITTCVSCHKEFQLRANCIVKKNNPCVQNHIPKRNFSKLFIWIVCITGG